MITMNYPKEYKNENLKKLRLEKRNEVALNSEHNLLNSKDLKNIHNGEIFPIINNYNDSEFNKNKKKNGKTKGEWKFIFNKSSLDIYKLLIYLFYFFYKKGIYPIFNNINVINTLIY